MKMVAWFHKLNYHEMIKCLNSTVLENRITHGDLVKTHKLLTGKEDINNCKYFQMNTSGSNLRGYDKKLFKVRCRLEIQRNFFKESLTTGTVCWVQEDAG